jgi:hypothetical protein
MVLITVIGAAVGTVGLENPLRTNIELENHFFSTILGHHLLPIPDTALSRAPIWKQLASDLDKQLTPGNRVLVDVSTVDFGAFVYTRHPDSYIVNSDRDYERIVADPVGKFNYLVLASYHIAAGGDLGTEYPLFQAILADTTGGHWVKWRAYFVATVYHWVPDAAPRG